MFSQEIKNIWINNVLNNVTPMTSLFSSPYCPFIVWMWKAPLVILSVMGYRYFHLSSSAVL